MSIQLQIKQLPHGTGIALPAYATDSAAGMDLRAAVDTDVDIEPSNHLLIPTGLSIALPHGFEAQIRPRSGMALKYGITVLNTPGTIDADYRGEIGVILINHGHAPFRIQRGDRIAQMIIAPVVQVDVHPVDILPDSKRGTGGFGSSGRH